MYRPTLGANFVATLGDLFRSQFTPRIVKYYSLSLLYISVNYSSTLIPREIAGHLHTFVLILGVVLGVGH